MALPGSAECSECTLGNDRYKTSSCMQHCTRCSAQVTRAGQDARIQVSSDSDLSSVEQELVLSLLRVPGRGEARPAPAPGAWSSITAGGGRRPSPSPSSAWSWGPGHSWDEAGCWAAAVDQYITRLGSGITCTSLATGHTTAPAAGRHH